MAAQAAAGALKLGRFEPAFIAARGGQPRVTPPDARPEEALWWARVDPEADVEHLIAPTRGPLLARDAFDAIEVWTDAELSAVHALWWLVQAGRAPAARLEEARAWHLEHTQPDNATGRPWAVHVFAAAGAPEPDLYAQTLLHNALVQDGRPTALAGAIIADAAAALRRVAAPGDTLFDMSTANPTVGALAPVLDHVDAQIDASLERLLALLRIPSVGTDPAHRGDTRRAAEYCAAQLTEIGFTARVNDTPGHPIVTARLDGPEGAPHLLYYGHYDVQPPDPLDEWKSPPFDPVVVDGPRGRRIVARGAVDDKGQLMTFIEAFRAWRDVHGALPIGATVLLEGEEESGSPSLAPFLEAHRDELAAAACVVSDTGMWDVETPAVTFMLRGLAYFEITLEGPGCDLHSGSYGGAVRNPILELARVLGALHDADGRVQIPGFYDDVRPLDDALRAEWEALGFDEKAFLDDIGLATPAGERGRAALDRLWARPTCDANGIVGGYIGVGAKTVIPARATAKLSCRLVADQDPQKIKAGLEAFLDARTPPDYRWHLETFSLDPAVRVPTESSCLQAALGALERAFGRKPVLIGCGGSIPLVGEVGSILGQDCLLVGFGLDDDRVHSPNEKFEVACFHGGIRAHAAMLEAFAGVST